MKHDTEKLQDLYVENYLQPVKSNATQNSTQVVEESHKEDEDDKKGAPKKGKKKVFSNKEKGGALYNDSVNFKSAFDKILEEFDEQGGGDFGGVGDDMGGDSEYNFSEEEPDEQVSVSKSVIKSIIDQLKELIGESDGLDLGDDEGLDVGEGELLDDDVPLESYGFEGNGREHGAKGNYDGKAKVQSKSNLVKDNGDADFGKQDTKYNPEDTEGSEGSHHGDQGNYDGKAKTQSKSTLVGDNGNANFGKSKVGAKVGKGTGTNVNYF